MKWPRRGVVNTHFSALAQPCNYASVSNQFSFDLSCDGQKADDALAILEDESRALGIYHGADEMTVGFGNASMRRGLIVAGQFALFHAGHAHEANHAVIALEDEAGTNLISDRRRETSVRFRNAPLGGRIGFLAVVLCRCSGVGYPCRPISEPVSSDHQQGAALDNKKLLTHFNNLSVVLN
jgi:hypothetical protein